MIISCLQSFPLPRKPELRCYCSPFNFSPIREVRQEGTAYSTVWLQSGATISSVHDFIPRIRLAETIENNNMKNLCKFPPCGHWILNGFDLHQFNSDQFPDNTFMLISLPRYFPNHESCLELWLLQLFQEHFCHYPFFFFLNKRCNQSSYHASCWLDKLLTHFQYNLCSLPLYTTSAPHPRPCRIQQLLQYFDQNHLQGRKPYRMRMQGHHSFENLVFKKATVGINTPHSPCTSVCTKAAVLPNLLCGAQRDKRYAVVS